MENTVLPISELLDCATAGQLCRKITLESGFSAAEIEEIVLAVAELTRNILKHAGRGSIMFRPLQAGDAQGIEVEAEDTGPGMADIERSFADGYSTAGGLGYGLGSVNRLMDEVDIASAPGLGTRLVCRRWMRPTPPVSLARVWDVGVATRSRHFASENGDAFVVKRWRDELLVGVIDGLGHGKPAQEAALAAQRYVQSHSDLPLGKIFVGADRACRATRGVVMALAHFPSPVQMNFASVGNVEARVWGAANHVQLLVKRGIVGLQGLTPAVQDLKWNPDWILVLHTDGIRARWQPQDFSGLEHEPPQRMASELMRALASDNDDATLLVVKRC